MPPVAIGIAVGAAVGGLAYGTITAVLVGGLLGGLAVAASMFLSPKISLPSPTYSNDIPRNTASTIYPVPIVFGSTNIAGNKIRTTAPGGTARECIVGLAEGPCNGIHRIKFNNKDFNLIKSGKSLFKPGASDEAAPTLATDFPLLAGEDIIQPFRNTATLWLRTPGQENTSVGFQTSCTLEGYQCWDLATQSARSFSRNPAVIAATYLHDFKGIDWADIDIPAFQALESYCNDYGDESDNLSENLVGAGSITASDYYSSGPIYPPENLYLDRGLDLEGVWVTNESPTLPVELKYDFGAGCAVRVARYELIAYQHASDQPTAWDFQGSTDGSTWTTLDSKTAQSFTVGNDYRIISDIPTGSIDRYRYYRWNFTAHTDNQIRLSQVKLYAKLGAITPRYTFDYALDTYQAKIDYERIMGRAFFGVLRKSQGKWKPLYFRNPGTTTFAFTKDHIEFKSLQCGVDETPNLIRVTYRNRSREFMRDVIEARDDNDISVRGEVIFEESCDWITDREAALRRAQFLYDLKTRLTETLSFKTGQYAAAVEEYDLVTVAHPLVGDGTTPKTYFVEERQEDANGCLSFKVREFDASVFSGRIVSDQPREIGPGNPGTVVTPETPDINTILVGAGGTPIVRGGIFQWQVSGTATVTSWMISVRLSSRDGSTVGAWSDWYQVQGTIFQYVMTDDEVATYGSDARVCIKIKARTSDGLESSESEAVCVYAISDTAARGADRDVVFVVGDGDEDTYTVNAAGYTAGSTDVLLQGQNLIRLRAGVNDGDGGTPDVWEYSEDAAAGTITLRGGSLDGAPYEIRYVPLATT